MKSLLVALFLALVCGCEAASLDQHADKLASLIDPAKLATLGQRGANPRIQKAVAILADAQADILDLGAVCAAAIAKVKMKPTARELTRAVLLRDLDIAKKLGCLNSDEAGGLMHEHLSWCSLQKNHGWPGQTGRQG